MTYAIVRKDLREQGELPPLMSVLGDELDFETNLYIWLQVNDLSIIFESFQPEAWDNDEYNLMIVDTVGRNWHAKSIDFDFYETIEQAEEGYTSTGFHTRKLCRRIS